MDKEKTVIINCDIEREIKERYRYGDEIKDSGKKMTKGGRKGKAKRKSLSTNVNKTRKGKKYKKKIDEGTKRNKNQRKTGRKAVNEATLKKIFAAEGN